jgi:hypothetical protein
MYPFFMLVAGLVLLLAGGGWFPGATTVGVILTIVGGVWFVIFLAVLLVALWAMADK